MEVLKPERTGTGRIATRNFRTMLRRSPFVDEAQSVGASTWERSSLPVDLTSVCDLPVRDGLDKVLAVANQAFTKVSHVDCRNSAEPVSRGGRPV